jgi:hypothetical protein
VVEDALLCDRAGSAVIEHILCKDEQKYHNLDLGLKETMMVACWYIWWMRRRRTHDEEVPPVNRCMISILSITSNAKVGLKGHATGVVWVKPKPRYAKLNVDASFHVDSRAGAVGAILRDSHGRFLAASRHQLGLLRPAQGAGVLLDSTPPKDQNSSAAAPSRLCPLPRLSVLPRE